MVRKDYSDVFAWLRCGDATPNPEMEDKFFDMVAEVVMERMDRTSRPRPRKVVTAALSIRSMMKEAGLQEGDIDLTPHPVPAEPETVPETLMENPDKVESKELDSVTAAKTIVHLAWRNDVTLNISQIQMILYIAYGICLAESGDRFMDEHPQMWQYGPVFPKVYNRLKRGFDDSEESYGKMKKEFPKEFGFLERCFRRYAWTSATVLNAPHVEKGSPWMKTRQLNPDKWGARIEDDLIRDWFKARI